MSVAPEGAIWARKTCDLQSGPSGHPVRVSHNNKTIASIFVHLRVEVQVSDNKLKFNHCTVGGPIKKKLAGVSELIYMV